MSILSWIKSQFNVRADAGAMRSPLVIGTGNAEIPVYSDYDFENYARNAYKSNELVYGAVRAIGSALAESKIVVKEEDGSVIRDHPAALLLERPSLFMSAFDFKYYYSMYFYLAGEVFLYKLRSASGKVVELRYLRPDKVRVSPSADPTKFIDGYIYEPGNGKRYLLDPENVIFDKNPDPLNEYRGVPPLLAALRQIDTDNIATDFSNVAMRNRAVPSLVVMTEETFTEAERERALAHWKLRNSGENRGGISFMGGVKEIKSIALDMQQLAFLDLRMMTETRILVVFGVPPVLLGVKSGLDRMTFNNMSEARRFFYDNTIQPFQNRIDDTLNMGVLPEFDKTAGRRLAFDNSGVTAYADVYKALRTEARDNWTAGVITRNEARIANGLNEAPDGDIFLRDPMSSMFGGLMAAPKPGEKLLRPGRKSAGIDLLASALNRRSAAERYLRAIRGWAQGEFEMELQEVKKLLQVFKTDGAPDRKGEVSDYDDFFTKLDRLELEWVYRINDDGGAILAKVIFEAAEAAAADLGIELFDLSNQHLQDFVRAYSFKFAKKLGETGVSSIRRIMFAAQEEGLSYSQMVSQMGGLFDEWDAKRAYMIARTETIRAANYAAVQVWSQEGVEVKEWVTADDACPYCTPMDGKRVSMGANFFDLGDTVEGQPGSGNPEPKPLAITYEDVGAPPLHPNCVLTGTPVWAPDKIGALRVLYSGPVVHLTTADGRRISVTVNHLFLTPQGWIAAQHIRKGDQILNGAIAEGVELGVDPNDYGQPTAIEQVVATLAKSRSMRTIGVPTAAEYLHGDGVFGQGEIDVVFPNSFLADHLKAHQFEAVAELEFNRTDVLRMGFESARMLAQTLERTARAADGVMGVRCESAAFSGREAAHPDVIGLADVSDGDSVLDQSVTDRGPGNAEILREGKFGLPGGVTLADVLDVEIEPHYAGPVFDLQTFSTIYNVNGLLSSNCRCVLIPVIEES